jgi:hypothetical protein
MADECHNPRCLEHIAYLAGQLEELQQAIREHLDAAPGLWQRGFEAGLHLAELQLARTKVERDEQLRQNAGLN